MIDYSRATISKSSKESFDKAANKIIDYIKDLQATYENTWIELETLRKERAAIIENVIQILKTSGAKLSKQLGRCNNDEINEELAKVVDTLPFKAREEVQVAIVKINNRYLEIVKKGTKLDALSEELSQRRVLEADYSDEVLISLSDIKTTDNITPPGLERVEKVSKAIPDIIDSLDSLLATKRRKNNDGKRRIPAIIEETDLTYKTDEINTDRDLSGIVQDELSSLYEIRKTLNDEDAINDYLNITSFQEPSDEEEFAVHVMKDDQTLAAIALNVYGDEKYWEDLYNYKDNKGKIDRKAAEYNTSITTAAHTVGILTNLELQFPTGLVIYEQVPAGNRVK